MDHNLVFYRQKHRLLYFYCTLSLLVYKIEGFFSMAFFDLCSRDKSQTLSKKKPINARTSPDFPGFKNGLTK